MSLTIIIIMIGALSGCGANLLKDEKCDAYLEQSIEAIAGKDKETFQGLFWKEIMESSETDWDEATNDVMENWKGSLESYEMTGKNVNVNSKNFNTKTYVQCTYRVVTTEETYNVVIVRVEDKEGLDAISRFYFEKNYEK